MFWVGFWLAAGGAGVLVTVFMLGYRAGMVGWPRRWPLPYDAIQKKKKLPDELPGTWPRPR